jgi:ABC-type transport system substrate-binding protein
MRRRTLLGGAAVLPLAAPAAATPPQQSSAVGPQPGFTAPPKTLRVAFNFAETGFDPPRVGDQSSIRVIAHIFEPLLTYDPLARPVVLMPLTAEKLPEASADFKRFVVTLQRGIFFADDPVFQGRPRELVAADYVYSFKRYYDPAIRTEHLHLFENLKILGLSELRQQAQKSKTPFPYDAPVAGLRVLDRYRFEVQLAQPAPRFNHLLAYWQTGAVAREVIEAHADDPLAHPVGTGPFQLAQWRRSSRIVLERNPRFREQRFATAGAGPEPQLQEAAQRLAGARAPLVDRVEIDVIDEAQPRWLAFLGGEHDVLTLPPEFGELAMPGGRVAPFLARQGVHAQRAKSATISHTFINCDDALVGGYTAERVALRRAIALAYDNDEEIRLVRRNQSALAQSMIPPGCYGHDPLLKSTSGQAQPARARALLEIHGYTDRNRDGWRERPDGSPLLLRISFPPDRRSRAISELWHKRLKAVGLRVAFDFAPFGELVRRSLAGQVMMWGFNWSAGEPDGDFFLGLAYGPNGDQSNDARFKLPAFDRLYERQRVLPDGPERLALMGQATRMMLAYVPYIPHSHTIDTELMHAHVRGPMRKPFGGDWYRWIDVGPRVA